MSGSIARTDESRVAVVTGAGSGIGRAIAHRMANDGMTVIVNDLYLDRAQQVSAEIVDSGGTAHPHGGDVADPADVAALSALIADRTGRVDILVNNAARGEGSVPIETQDVARWQAVVDAGLRGPYLCAQRMGADFMVPARFGRIVTISSIVGMVGHPMMHAYASAKAGVIMFTKTLAAEWARYGITVNAVAPGYIATENVMRAIATGRYDGEALRRRIPVGRLGDPDEVAHAVAFLTSSQSGYITGTVLPVDGGWTAFGGPGDASAPSAS